MKIVYALSFVALFCASNADAGDGFEKVRCGGDIVKALVGQPESNERIVVLEARHKDIGLKDLGALEADNGWFPITWLICGQEFLLIVSERTDVVADALAIPPHSKSHPKFQGSCKRNGVAIPDGSCRVPG